MDLTKIKAVLFDLDDTLYSRRDAAKKTFYGMFREQLYPIASDELIHRAVEYMMSKVERNSMISENAFQALIAEFPPEVPYVRSSCVDYYYEHIVEFVIPFPEQTEIIAKLRATGIKTAIVTNIPEERVFSQRAKVDALRLCDVMDAVVISGEIGIHKPDKRIYLYTCDLLGVLPEQCIFVGDDPDSDIKGALSAGMEAVWYDVIGGDNPFDGDPRVHRVNSVGEYFDL